MYCIQGKVYGSDCHLLHVPLLSLMKYLFSGLSMLLLTASALNRTLFFRQVFSRSMSVLVFVRLVTQHFSFYWYLVFLLHRTKPNTFMAKSPSNNATYLGLNSLFLTILRRSSAYSRSAPANTKTKLVPSPISCSICWDAKTNILAAGCWTYRWMEFQKTNVSTSKRKTCKNQSRKSSQLQALPKLRPGSNFIKLLSTKICLA